jgi:hypothetical protein
MEHRDEIERIPKGRGAYLCPPERAVLARRVSSGRNRTISATGSLGGGQDGKRQNTAVDRLKLGADTEQLSTSLELDCPDLSR